MIFEIYSNHFKCQMINGVIEGYLWFFGTY